MKRLIAIAACTLGMLNFTAPQTEACFFGCCGLHSYPQTCGYAPTNCCPTTSYYGSSTSFYSPYTSYYAPYTSYYVPATSYYTPTTSYYGAGCCTSCPSNCNSCCPGTCGTGACGTGACTSGTCASGNCGITSAPAGPPKTAAAPRQPQARSTITRFVSVSTSAAESNRTQTSHKPTVTSSGWEPIPATR